MASYKEIKCALPVKVPFPSCKGTRSNTHHMHRPVWQLHMCGPDNDGNKSTLRPLIKPEDVADGILFLASDRARTISGAIVPVDLGWSAI
jgi:NAD(P)-dependent dehydrogenase (short-subunit alcohol dehydrogenase family)